MKKLYLWLGSLACLWLLGACQSSGPYVATFDEAGNWGVGEEPVAVGRVVNGMYELTVKEDIAIYWATAGESFGDGVYEVEATHTAGANDNGYGLMFMVNNDTNDFYLLEVSSDGYMWLARCHTGCEGADTTVLLEESWVENSAIRQGVGSLNRLKVDIQQGNMIFYINDQEVGRAFDATFTQGDVGILVETLGSAGVTVQFDNVKFTPAGN